MNLNYRTMLIVLFVIACRAEIITRSFVLFRNLNVDIENNTTRLFDKDSFPAYTMDDSILKIQCSDNTTIDLVYRSLGFWDNLECECGGEFYGVTSKYPIYTIKTQSVSIFINPLDTTDTAKINREYSLNYKYCDFWFAVQSDRSTRICGVCTLSVSPPPIYWHLGKTHENHYFLFRFDTTSRTEDSTIPLGPTAKIICIIQKDGSLNFSKAFEISIANANEIGSQRRCTNSTVRKIFSYDMTGTYSSLYDIQGKRIQSLVQSVPNRNAIRLYIQSK
jgi:hypothetical protein